MASDTIRTKGILHFTISVRDHEAAAKYYSELIGCEITRINNHFAFMRCGDDHFVLAKMANHVSPNPPRGTHFHHAFIVDPPEFDRAYQIVKDRGIDVLAYDEVGHRTFPGRHLYFHDPDGNGIEIVDPVTVKEAPEKEKAPV